MRKITSLKEQSKWKARIKHQKTSGKTVREWCLENKLKTRSFYYWRSKLVASTLERSNFTELVDNEKTGVTIEYKGVNICIDKNFDTETLKLCVIALGGIKCL